MNDIASRSDIELLMRTFYGHLLQIPEMRKVFEHTDIEKHIPNIVHFWSFVLLDEEGYRTNVFEKHLHLPIEPPQFDIWLKIFCDSVDELFAGEIAELAKTRAISLAYTFKAKWTQLRR